MAVSQNLGLPYLEAGQAQKHVTHNEALRALDAIVQLSVKDRDLAAPPGSPADGDRYIVAASPTGVWAGHAAHVAIWQDGAWDFHDPQEGWRCWVDDENVFLIFDGSAWVDWGAALGALQNLSRLGVGTTADATNPFAAKLNNALWTAKYAAESGDGDLRATMNKETAADVVSLLLQTGFSGRAEVGLIGDDDLVVKVSPDGSTWLEALRLNKTTGVVTFAVSSPGGLRERLTANRTYYVRADGSNSNNGLADTSGGAFLTIQKAVDVISGTLDLAGFTVTIQIADGTYTGTVTLANCVGFKTAGQLIIKGNNGTPANVLVNTASAAFSATGLFTVWDIRDLKIQTSGGEGLRAVVGSFIRFSNIVFGTCSGAHMSVGQGGKIEATGNYSIVGGASIHMAASTTGTINMQSKTVTITGTPAFGTAFAWINAFAYIEPWAMTYSGSATGKRYDVSGNGVINVGGSATYFPGNSAGSTASGGQYV